MTDAPKCPKCGSEDSYPDQSLWICPLCAHEWNEQTRSSDEAKEAEAKVVRDSNGNALQDGDSVTVIKDLKIKGASSSVKSGTKVRNIRILLDAEDGHNIS